MKRCIVTGLVALLVCSAFFSVVAKNNNKPSNKPGFDKYGYNYSANVFNGPADGVDRKLDDAVWGDPTYANDKLMMKWNEQWDICNGPGNNTNPNYCAGAWTKNEWNGNVPGGSGEVWHYTVIWVGPKLGPGYSRDWCNDNTDECAELGGLSGATGSGAPGTSEYWRTGGEPIWDNYEIIISHGTVSGPVHLWEVHAKPSGLR